MRRREAEADSLDPIETFITRWAGSSAAERANFQSFAVELCDVLGVDRPQPATADPARDRYRFDYPVRFPNQDGSTSPGFIDLYKRDAFVMEAKQGSDQQLEGQLALFGGLERQMRKGTAVRGTKNWTAAMQRARGQAESYAKALPVDHGWPPFLFIVDVGHCFELYADFTRTGKSYSQFPDAQSFRIPLDGLRDEKVRERLRLIWIDPLSLDPSKHAAEVTREVSRLLAVVARSLEGEGHHPELVAGFLMRCLFCMFAEDIGLLPERCFTDLLKKMRGRDPKQLAYTLEMLWDEMDRGVPFSPTAEDRILQFNGRLFKERTALPLKPEHLGLLIEAAERSWRYVEPAIFGTFLEQALNPRERRKLGAEFTPRRWVERLVMPAVIEPLRERWNNVKAAALAYGIAGDRNAAIVAVKDFHHELCHLRILDPACGSGNFLYVAMEHMKRIEGEVLDVLRNDLAAPAADLHETINVDPHQFLGIEINPRAAMIAEVVLWIGYLQWHFMTHGKIAPVPPVLKNYRNIKHGDAILAYDREELVRDEQGRPVTRWDGHSMRTDLATGRQVPDETKRVELYRYINPRPAKWPEADFIVGNPPFIGGKDGRSRLGAGYAEALWRAYPDMPRSADFVMYWWRRAADLVRTGKARRFALITTNSLPQTFNRRVIAAQLNAKPPLGLVFAIPDHPWYLSGDMSAVRIAMTVGAAGKQEGQLFRVVDSRLNAAQGGDDLRPPLHGLIISNLTIGVDLDAAKPLLANEALCSPGVKLHGSGFIVSPERAKQLGLGCVPDLDRHIRPYRNGKDLTGRPRGVMVIDLFGLSEEDVLRRFPSVYQHVLANVKSEREAKIGKSTDMEEYAKKWWLFGKPRYDLRLALADVTRYIVTVETAKHRVFEFLDKSILPDNRLIVVALDDAHLLGVFFFESACCMDPSQRWDTRESTNLHKKHMFRPVSVSGCNGSSAGDHPRSRRAARRASQAGAGGAPRPDAHWALQRPGEAAGLRGAD